METIIFQDNDETRQWMAYLQTLSALSSPVTLPGGQDLRETLRYLEIPDEDIPDVMCLAEHLRDDPTLWSVLERAVWSLNEHMGKVQSPPRFAMLRDINDPQYRHFYVLVFTAALSFVQTYFQSRGVPDDIAQATLADLGRNVRVHRKREGVGGLGVAWWLMLHFRGMIYQLGRLQFERAEMREQVAESVINVDGSATTSTPVLSIHIPDFMGPMTPEACDDAIAQACKFFPLYFPEERYGYAVCHSWLLDPRLKEVLKPDSNIIRFQDRFTLAGKGWDSNDGIMQFVFGKTTKDVDSVKPLTSLERGVVDHIRSGGTWWGYGGWFRLNPDEAAGHQI